MKGAMLTKPYNIQVKEIKEPAILEDNDIIIKNVFSGICGSDLHIYTGKVTIPNKIMGHEALGIVEKKGRGVTNLDIGDLVIVPFDVGCGFCKFCRTGMTAYCELSNAGKCGIEYSHGDITGAQAEYIRVPYADFNALKINNPENNKLLDYIFLADNFPTAWYGVAESGFKSGDSIVIYGSGSVGLLAAYSAKLQGASNIFVVDSVEERLKKASEIGAIPINYKNENAVEKILKYNNNLLPDRGIDAVGAPSILEDKKRGHFSTVIDSLVDICRPDGGIYIIGVYPIDTHIDIDYGKIYYKGIHFNGGKASVQKYYMALLNLIASGSAAPSKIVRPKVISPDAIPDAYDKFYNHDPAYTKPIIKW